MILKIGNQYLPGRGETDTTWSREAFEVATVIDAVESEA